MTMVDARDVIENLRRKIKELEEKAEKYEMVIRNHLKKLKAVTNKVKEWDLTHMRDPHAAPSILADLEKMLGLESEK